MTPGLTLIVCLMLSAGAPAAQSTEASEAAGRKAAESWLKLIDAGQLGTAWDQSSTTFRTVVPRRDFEKKMKAARAPLGKFIARKFVGTRLTHQLHGAPDGTYVIVEYERAVPEEGACAGDGHHDAGHGREVPRGRL